MAKSKKGSIMNHSDNFHLDSLIIQEIIRAVYKSFHLLKANPDCWDTWIANLIQAKHRPKAYQQNPYGNNTDKQRKHKAQPD